MRRLSLDGQVAASFEHDNEQLGFVKLHSSTSVLLPQRREHRAPETRIEEHGEDKGKGGWKAW